jgi:muramoyltetrapeptide carboxypeptidase LdcA involved in peptidoglycan recycling
MKEGQEYQSQSWLKAVTQDNYDLVPSKDWSSDAWYLPDAPRTFYPTEWKVYKAGSASGTAIGGNLSTFALLRGTPYAPQVENYVLFVEEAEGYPPEHFLREFAALLQAYPNPQAVIIGRFPKECEMTEEILLAILDKHPLLKTIPVLYDVDFAHTQPLFTITIGGQVTLDTEKMVIHVQTK